jgi:uncharacterized protein with WD repeat
VHTFPLIEIAASVHQHMAPVLLELPLRLNFDVVYSFTFTPDSRNYLCIELNIFGKVFIVSVVFEVAEYFRTPNNTSQQMIFLPKNEYILSIEGAPQWVWSMAVGVVVC